MARVNLERALQGQVRQVVKEEAKAYQKMLDSLSRRYKGEAVDKIKPRLSREWSRIGGKITDPELTELASQISQGARIQMRAK